MDIWQSRLGILAGSIIILGLTAYGLLLTLGYIDFPTYVWGETEVIVLLTIFGALGLGAWFIVLPMLRLHNTPIEILFVVNAERDTILDFWIMHPVRMAKVEVVEGRAYKQSVLGIPCYIVREYDPRTREATGVWLGEANDIELVTSRDEIRANRGRLREWAQIGQQLYSKLPSIAQAVESSYWRAMSNDSIDRVTNHPDVVKNEVVEDVEKLVESIERPGESQNEPDAEEMMERGVESEVGGVPDEWADGSPGDGE